MNESQEWFNWRKRVIDHWPMMTPGRADEYADMLVEATGEQAARIAALEAENAALSDRVRELEAALSALADGLEHTASVDGLRPREETRAMIQHYALQARVAVQGQAQGQGGE